jgi:DNA-binding FadR family transcriptional regulator
MPTDASPGQKLEAYLRSSGLREGDRLQPERQLTTLLGVSRRALREMLAKLELEGRIWRGVGQGTYLGPRAGRPAARAVPRPARPTHPLAIMEARLTLEPALASLAAIKATAEDIEAISRSAGRGAETRNEESWGRWDSAFHRGVAAACHNPLLLDAFTQIEVSRAHTDWGQLRAVIATAGLRLQSAQEHQIIASAIAARDPAAAHQAMWDHLQSVNRAIQSAGAAFGKRNAQPVALAAGIHGPAS